MAGIERNPQLSLKWSVQVRTGTLPAINNRIHVYFAIIGPVGKLQFSNV